MPAPTTAPTPTDRSTERTVDRPAERRRLDQEAVIAAAEELLDEVGYDELSMTLLARRLDTRVSTLYNHVASLEDLRSALQLRAMRQLGQQVRTAAMGRVGADGIRVLAERFREYALAHPHRYEAMTRVPIDVRAYYAAASEAAEALSVMVRTAGVPESRMLQTMMAIFAALHGHLSLEVTGFFSGAPGMDEVFAQVLRGAITAAVVEATAPEA